MKKKTCPQCRREFGPVMRGARRESPAAFARRITCSITCAAERKRHLSDEETKAAARCEHGFAMDDHCEQCCPRCQEDIAEMLKQHKADEEQVKP